MRVTKPHSLSKVTQEKHKYTLSWISTTNAISGALHDTFEVIYKYPPHYGRYPDSYVKIFRRFKYIKRLSDYYYYYSKHIRPLSKLARRHTSLSRKCGINKS